MPSGSTCLTSRLSNAARAIADGLLSIALAPSCAACGSPVDRPTHSAVCSRCWTRVEPLTPFGACSFPPHISLATAIGPYDDALKDIVHALKYDQRRTIARQLAARMRAAGVEMLRDADAVVPVPLHRARERSRGYNQAAELARHLDVPMIDALMRVRETATQADLAADARERNVRGAFALQDGVVVTGLTLVLVDDVSTTGATLNACAAPLLAAGAREVRALTAARAPLRRSTGR